jgi:phenylacetate-CoA ligase
VTPADVDLAVADCPTIDLYKLEQDEAGCLRFRYILNQAPSPDLLALQQRISALCQTRDIIFEAVDYIACERSGKFNPAFPDITGHPTHDESFY